MKTRQQCLEIQASCMQFFAEQFLKSLIKQFHFRRMPVPSWMQHGFLFLPLFLFFFTLVEAQVLSRVVP